MLNEMQIRQYLPRIEYGGILSPDLSVLSGLQWAHITHIPYENLDILTGIPLSLDVEDLFQKIIVATVNPDGTPYSVPVHYALLHDMIYIHGLPTGQKIRNIKDNPNVYVILIRITSVLLSTEQHGCWKIHRKRKFR